MWQGRVDAVKQLPAPVFYCGVAGYKRLVTHCLQER
jgi:hypothetical protein